MSIPADDIAPDQAYVLVTAAHNEESLIQPLIDSVVSQSVRPLRWAIISDASTDRTDEIVKANAREYPFIDLVRLEKGHGYSFAAQARAIMVGYEHLKPLPFKFIGTLDADITLEPQYYAELLKHFREDRSLGITGGFIYERRDGVFSNRPGNRTWSVAGATQFFRRQCFEQIGGILPLRYGGHDWCAEVSARMNGWKVVAVPELKVFHHRPTGTARNLLRHLFHQGKMDHSLGCLPAFEILKCLARLPNKPFVIGALARLAGFVSAYCVGAKRSVSREFIRFIRQEQRRRLIPGFSRES